MFKSAATVSAKAALPPGSLIHVGRPREEKPYIWVMNYDSEHVEMNENVPTEKVKGLICPGKKNWINIMGVHDVELVRQIGEAFSLHPLVQEDILNTHHRPKVEEFGDYLFIVMKLIHFNEAELSFTNEQISLVLGPDWVISFQEGPPDPFAAVAERISKNRGRIRRMGADYLAYSLMDGVVDSYFLLMENLGNVMEYLEDQVLAEPDRAVLNQLYQLKRELLEQRRAVWPLRELISSLVRGEFPIISEETLPYIRDVYDHTIQVIESTETLRENLAGLIDLYLNSVSNRMNEVMKVLTIVSTIFIPLTFLAGIYGMNFQHMPELAIPWAYPALLAVMLGIGLGMRSFFRRKKWL